jgi:CMP/dCMP kinase
LRITGLALRLPEPSALRATGCSRHRGRLAGVEPGIACCPCDTLRAVALLIAIDGPAGAGKSATARELAQCLGLPYLDTGAMYRALALLALRRDMHPPLDPTAEARLVEMAQGLAVEFGGGARSQRVLLAGEDVTEKLRTPDVSEMASVVSAVSPVRREMVRQQREIAARTGGVVEGRDIGTVVFPEASLKIFLTAMPEVRARRRFDELARRGIAVRWEEVLEEQRLRDHRDSTRADSPLKPAPDAVVVDTSGLDLAQVVEKIVLLLA